MKSLLLLLPLFFFVSCVTRISTSNTMGEVAKQKNAKFEVTPIKKIILKDLVKSYKEIYGDDTNFTKKFQSTLKLKIDKHQIDNVSSCIIEFPSIEIGRNIVRIPKSNVGRNDSMGIGQGQNMLVGRYDYMPCCAIDLHYIVKSNNGDTLLEGHALAEIGGGIFARNSVMLTNSVEYVQKFLVSYLRGKMKNDYIQISKSAR